jgi:IS4 transposase
MTTIWARPKCGRRSTRKNHRHACGTGDREYVLRNRRQEIVEPYGALENFVESLEAWTYLTNDVEGPAVTVADFYRSRWQLELFFRWIKQDLPTKAFYGTSPNAVRTQIWVAVTAYVLVAIVRWRPDIHREM